MYINWKAPHKSKASDKMCSIYTLKRQSLLCSMQCRVHTKTRQISFALFCFCEDVLALLRNNACKQIKVSTFASLMCKSCKLRHMPYFCVELSNYKKSRQTKNKSRQISWKIANWRFFFAQMATLITVCKRLSPRVARRG